MISNFLVRSTRLGGRAWTRTTDLPPLISNWWAEEESNLRPLRHLPRTKFWIVGAEGVEPSTSALSEQRSTDELRAPFIYIIIFYPLKHSKSTQQKTPS